MRPVRYNVAASLDGYIAGPAARSACIMRSPLRVRPDESTRVFVGVSDRK